MQFVEPTWSLRSPRCPCCDDEGSLVFYTCPTCGHVVVVCDEMASVYPDPKNVEIVLYPDTPGFRDSCPKCTETAISEFRPSNSEEIRNAGFNVGEYE